MKKNTISRVRRGVLFLAFLLFPFLFKWLSPYVIIIGAREQVVNGSLIVFAALFVLSLFFGRAWCGWICPGGGLAESCGDSLCTIKAPNKKFTLIKWGIWVVWMGVIIFFAVRAGGFTIFDPLFHNEGGYPMHELDDFFIYYGVVAICAGLPFIFGQRAMCKYICWMAPFQIIGRKMANFLRLPGLRICAHKDRCISCKVCDKQCPMNLPVMDMVIKNKMEHSECILCGNCVSKCPKSAISYTVGSAK